MVDTRLRRLLGDLEASEAAWKRADTTPEARHAKAAGKRVWAEELHPEMRSNASAVRVRLPGHKAVGEGGCEAMA